MNCLIRHNITVSVPMGIHYHSILICLDSTHFYSSNYVLCDSNGDKRVVFDLDRVEAKLGHYALFSQVSRFNIQFPFIKQKPTQA